MSFEPVEDFLASSGLSGIRLAINLFGISLVYKNKALEPYLLPVLLLEALELPGKVERANLQKPHAEYVIRPMATLSRCNGRNIHIHISHLLFATVLTLPKKFSRFQAVKKERRVNAFIMSVAEPPALPVTGVGSIEFRLCLRRSAVANLATIFCIYNISINFNNCLFQS